MIRYPANSQLLSSLTEIPADSLDFIVLATGTDAAGRWIPCLDAALRALREGRQIAR